MFHLIERVRRVGIAAQGNIGPAGSNPFQHIHIPTGLNFYLDAAVTGGQLNLNFLEQLLDRILNSD